MHQRATASELHALASHEDLQGAVEGLLAVALALDEFAAEGGEGGGVADWETVRRVSWVCVGWSGVGGEVKRWVRVGVW